MFQTLKNMLPLKTSKFLSSFGAVAAFEEQVGRHTPFANYLLNIFTEKDKALTASFPLS